MMTVGALSTAFAQSGRESRDVILGQHGRGPSYGGVYDRDDRRWDDDRYSNYSFSAKERDVEIRRIDKFYDARVREVRKDRYMRSSEKDRQIRSLEYQKSLEIRRVNERFNDRRNSYSNERSYRNNRRY